ncbi:hypothetical protein Tco_1457946 [Tanacetum coccineum]
MKEQAYNIDRYKDHKSLTTKAISLISRRTVTINSLRGRLLASNIESNKEVRLLMKVILGSDTNAIETIAIYETKPRMACDSTDRVECQKDKVAKDASDKRKWEGNLGGSSSQ